MIKTNPRTPRRGNKKEEATTKNQHQNTEDTGRKTSTRTPGRQRKARAEEARTENPRRKRMEKTRRRKPE